MAKNFDEMNSIGKIGEEKIFSYLSSLGYEITDVSALKEYQDIDVDFIVNNNIKLEIKTDTQISSTSNLLFEDCFFYDWGDVDGWLHKCKADYIAFYDTESNKVYWVDAKVMKEVIPRRGEYRIYNSPGDGCRKSCYLLDLATALSCRTPGKLVIGKTLIQ